MSYVYSEIADARVNSYQEHAGSLKDGCSCPSRLCSRSERQRSRRREADRADGEGLPRRVIADPEGSGPQAFF
jgi:hypothetical protein